MVKLLLVQLEGWYINMLSLFKNDLKQLKDFFVIYIGCLVLNFIISGLSYNQDIAVITFYLIVLSLP